MRSILRIFTRALTSREFHIRVFCSYYSILTRVFVFIDKIAKICTVKPKQVVYCVNKLVKMFVTLKCIVKS